MLLGHDRLLMRNWGMSRDQLRTWCVGWDGERATLPIRVRGRLRDVRRLDPHDVGPSITWSPYLLCRDLWPDALNHWRTREVWLVADEVDALCLRDRGLFAVTRLGGWDSPPKVSKYRSVQVTLAVLVRNRLVRTLLGHSLPDWVSATLRSAEETRLVNPAVSGRPLARDLVRHEGWTRLRFLQEAARTKSC